MSCYHPIIAWRSRRGRSPKGGWPLVFQKSEGFTEVKIPCGGCIGCKLDRSRMWAIRCVNEAQMHKENCFITLTYNDQNLPKNESLTHRDFQLFIKRLRKKNSAKIKYFMCGEYGDDHLRPHYHACLFNVDFKDKIIFKVVNGVKIYTSEILKSLWPFGYSTIGEVNFESAAYIARYCIKGNKEDKSIIFSLQLEPEYQRMSNRPGIGKNWVNKFIDDVMKTDFIIINNKLQVKVPRYYNSIIKSKDKEGYIKLKNRREKKINKNDQTFDRLNVREELKKEQFKKLKRSYENENVFS